MRLPSGDHTGLVLMPLSKVNRELALRANSCTQISLFPEGGTMREVARRFPSGEIAIELSKPGSIAAPSALPCRSNHVGVTPSGVVVRAGMGGRYTRTPVGETENAPAGCVTGNASPLSSSLRGSKG